MKGIIWLRYRHNCEKYLNNIIQDYELINIKPIKKVCNIHKSFVEFENGDFWEVVPCNESQRGRACHISYISELLNKIEINTLIRPATKLRPYTAFKYIDEVDN